MLQNTREATLAAGARRGGCPRRTGGCCLWPPAWLDRGRLRGAEHPSQRVKTTKPGEIPPFHMLIQHGANRQRGLWRPQRDVEGSNPGPSLTAPHQPGAVGTRQRAGCRAGEEQTSPLCRPVGAAVAVCSRRRGLQWPSWSAVTVAVRTCTETGARHSGAGEVPPPVLRPDPAHSNIPVLCNCSLARAFQPCNLCYQHPQRKQ